MKYGDILIAILRGRDFKEKTFPLILYERDLLYWIEYVIQNMN